MVANRNIERGDSKADKALADRSLPSLSSNDLYLGCPARKAQGRGMGTRHIDSTQQATTSTLLSVERLYGGLVPQC